MNILQPDTWGNGSANNGEFPLRFYYEEAFRGDFSMWWGSTPFQPEIRELCFYRALTCFYGGDMEDIEDRRRLLYHYLKYEFASSQYDDDINRLAHKLPIASFVPKALRNLCIAYNQPPSRQWGTEGEPDAYNADFQHIYEEMSFDRAAQRIYRLAKLCNLVLVRPYIDEDTGKFRVEIFTPDMFRVVCLRREISEVWYRAQRINEKGEAENVLRVWTEERAYYADLEGEEISGTEEPNPYGRLPFCVLRMESPENDDPYGGDSMFDLVEANLAANQKEFCANVGLTMNGFGMWLFMNTQLDEKGLSITPAKAIVAEGVAGGETDNLPPHVEHIVGNALFQEISTQKRDGVREALRNEEIPDSLLNDNPGLPVSGVARVIERMPLLESRDSDKLTLKPFERDFAELVSVVANVDGYEAVALPEEFDFNIDFAEEKIYIEPDLDYELKRKMAGNGDISLQEYGRDVMGIDETDEDRIAEIIAERRERWKKAQGAPEPPPVTPGQPDGAVPPSIDPKNEEEMAEAMDTADMPAQPMMNGVNNGPIG